MRFVLISAVLVACNSKGTVVLDPDGNIVDDTAVVDDDTGNPTDTDDTDSTDTQDTEDTNGTSDTEDTDPVDTDTDEPVEIPADNNNPNVYPNEWWGTRVLNFDGCSETITEDGYEVSQEYSNWMSVCNCDEIYYVEVVDTSSACGLPVQTAFYRAVKYNGTEIDILYYPDPNASGPYEPSLLATAVILSDGETWSYEYSAQTAVGIATLDGLLTFTE